MGTGAPSNGGKTLNRSQCHLAPDTSSHLKVVKETTSRLFPLRQLPCPCPDIDPQLLIRQFRPLPPHHGAS